MRRLLVVPALFFAAALVLTSLSAPPVAAQPAPPAEESFPTADGVELVGLFHATATNANNAPVVVLLYPPGPDRDMTKGDWAGLAKRLNDEGYHVFRFDWRGHGKSTSISDPQEFWTNTFFNSPQGQFNYNSYIKGGGALKKPVKKDLLFKDLTKAERYMPAYLTDLAAVRVHLDGKNDKGELNTSSIYLIGAGDAATLGMAWMTAEWQRPAVFPTPGLLGVNVGSYKFVPQQLTDNKFSEGGRDIGGAVWLSASRPTSVPEAVPKRWISTIAQRLRENNPMLFLYADKDAAGKRGSEFFYNDVLVANPRKGLPLEPLDQTFIKEVKGGNAASGVKLLGDNKTLGTEDTIVKFLAAIQKTRAKKTPVNRDYKKTLYYIKVNEYGFVP